jgi:UDP-N-acetylglucosamine 2-epimerase (non-hydrolysing)
MAPVVKKLEASDYFESLVCFSGQHRDLATKTLALFGIEPMFDLDLMRESQGLSSLSSLLINEITKFLTSTKPDLVLVHGDTTTAFMSSLASFYQRIPVGHVEAGLRTHDTSNPFPEELNRQAIARLASIHFAPTDLAKSQLLAEGISEEAIHVTGNTVVDALKILIDKLGTDNKENQDLKDRVKTKVGFDFENTKFALMTSHRRESLGSDMGISFSQVAELVSRKKEYRIVFPVHPNPLVKNKADQILGNHDRIHLIEPMDYSEFLTLLNKCKFVITDSGGIQEEAVSLGVPVIVTRDGTERPEGLKSGLLQLVGNSGSSLLSVSEALIAQIEASENLNAFPGKEINSPYGDGLAADRILEALTLIKT